MFYDPIALSPIGKEDPPKNKLRANEGHFHLLMLYAIPLEEGIDAASTLLDPNSPASE